MLLVRLSEHFWQRLFALGRAVCRYCTLCFSLLPQRPSRLSSFSRNITETAEILFCRALAYGVVGSVNHGNSTKQQNTATQRLFFSLGPASGVVDSVSTYMCFKKTNSCHSFDSCIFKLVTIADQQR
jgi:hypothetical protein